jgi:MFS transporter, DHA1 family, multidrug resistance protein
VTAAAGGWRRTQHALVGGVFIYFSGMNFVMPFLPLYVQELDGVDLGRAALWSGLILAASPLVSGTVAPLWGVLTDRYGAKLMLLRSMAGFTLCLGLMGAAGTAWHLLALRVLMGLFAGFNSAAATLIATSNPPEQVTGGLGKVQSARVLGLAAGPLLGGLLADALGYRAACVASAGLGAVALIVVVALVRDGRPRRVVSHPAGRRDRSVRAVLGSSAFLSVLSVVLTTRLVERTFDPVLPLLISYREAAGGLGVATVTALITSAGLFAAAASSALAGRVVARLDRDRTLRGALVVVLLGLLAMTVVTPWPALLAIRVLIGAALGLTLTLGYATTADETPRERYGLALSVLGTGSSYGATIGLMGAGALAMVSLPLVFLVDGLLVGAVALGHLAVRRRYGPTSGPTP